MNDLTDREWGEQIAQIRSTPKRRKALESVPQERRSMVRQYMQQVVDARLRYGQKHGGNLAKSRSRA